MKHHTLHILLSLVGLISILVAEPTDETAYKKLTGLESEGLHIQLEEPHPWNPRDHEVWKVWFSKKADVHHLLVKASVHLSELRKPIEFSLMGHELRPHTLNKLKSVRNLRYLNLSNTNATDSHLRDLEGISSLWAIDLSDTYITANGLGYLRNCTDLRDLQAYSLDLRGQAFGAISNLKGLRVLCVCGSLIDANGWNHIASLDSLHELRCSLTLLSDNGLDSISKLRSLETLIAYSNSMSDVGVRKIQNLQSLKFLFLDNNSITDASLGTFEKLSNLKQIGLRKTQVNKEALVGLTRSLPDLYIMASHGAYGNESNKDPVGEPFLRRVGEVKVRPPSTGLNPIALYVGGLVAIVVFAVGIVLWRRRATNIKNKS